MSIVKYEKLQIVSLYAALFALCHLISVKLRLLCYVTCACALLFLWAPRVYVLRLSLPVRACAAVLFVCVRTAVFAGFRRCRYAGFGHRDMGRKMVKTQDKIIFRSGKSKYNGC